MITGAPWLDVLLAGFVGIVLGMMIMSVACIGRNGRRG